MGKINISPVAQTIPFDNSSNQFTATNTQQAIEEVSAGGGSGASPGFQFTRSGNASSGTYLLVGSVPSNITGSPVGLSNSRIVALVVTNESVNTFTIEVLEHDGSTFTSLGTFDVSGLRYKSFNNLNISVTAGKELAVKLSSGSAKNIVANIYVKGNSV